MAPVIDVFGPKTFSGHGALPQYGRRTCKYGMISTHSIEIRFDKIETVQVKQGLLGRILNYGDIVVTGTGVTFDPIRNIASAMKFRMALNDAMDPAAQSASATPSVA